MQSTITDAVNNRDDYNLYNQNCVDHMNKVLKSGGFDTINTMFSKDLMNFLPNIGAKPIPLPLK